MPAQSARCYATKYANLLVAQRKKGSKEREREVKTAAIKNAIMEKQRKRQSAKKWPKSATCGAGKGVPRARQREGVVLVRGCQLFS